MKDKLHLLQYDITIEVVTKAKHLGAMIDADQTMGVEIKYDNSLHHKPSALYVRPYIRIRPLRSRTSSTWQMHLRSRASPTTPKPGSR
eukprot:2149850-Pyramimonas_sp.AAC.1